MWIAIIIIAVIIGGIVGLLHSNEDEKGPGCLGGALFGGIAAMGCLGRIFFTAVSILLVLWLFRVLFGSCS